MELGLVSVIVPVYNTAHYIQECANSILKQSWKSIELILVDDGSTDGSGLICDNISYADERVKVIHKLNGGVSSARNAGLDVARGEYIGFVDSDDRISPEMYATLVNKLESDSSIGIVSCGLCSFESDSLQNDYRPEWYIEDDRLTGAKEYLSMVVTQHRSFNIVCKLFRHSIIEDLRFRQGILAEDLFFMFDLSLPMCKSGFSMLEIPEIYYQVRQRIDSYCSSGRPIELSAILNYRTMVDELQKRGNYDDAIAIKRTCYREIIDLNSRILIWPIDTRYVFECRELLDDISAKDVIKSRLSNTIKYLMKYIVSKYFSRLYPCIYRLLRSK